MKFRPGPAHLYMKKSQSFKKFESFMPAMYVDTSKQINDSLIIENFKLNESIQNLELSLPKFKNI